MRMLKTKKGIHAKSLITCHCICFSAYMKTWWYSQIIHNALGEQASPAILRIIETDEVEDWRCLF